MQKHPTIARVGSPKRAGIPFFDSGYSQVKTRRVASTGKEVA
jgi:hypothetical protein